MDNPAPAPVRESCSEKISRAIAEKLYGCIDDVLLASQEKRRRFVETVELQVLFYRTGYPTHRGLKFAVCVIGNQAQCDEAERNKLGKLKVTELKQLMKRTKPVKKIAKKYRAFMATKPMMKKIPRLLVNGLSKAGKFPAVLAPQENIMAKLAELEATIKFKVKKKPLFGVPVGNVRMDRDMLADNIKIAINAILNVLATRRPVVRSLHIKSTMGRPQKLY
ncbi:hypothetical protein MTO96_006996 [Rhipicephalus appendiculatus]